MKYLYLLINLLCFVFFSNAQIQWEHTNGPEGGKVYSIVSNKDYAFFSDAFFTYRTADRMLWEKLPVGNLWPFSAGDNKLAAFQIPENYPSTDEEVQFLVSHDNGLSWQNGNLPDLNSGFLYPLFVTEHGVYGRGNQALFRTKDDGITWESISLPEIYPTALVAYGDFIFCQIDKSVYLFDPVSDEWILIMSSLGQSERIGCAFVQDQKLIIATTARIWTSEDSGITWQVTGQNGFSHYDRIVELNGRIYILSESESLVYSDNGGLTWKSVSLSIHTITDLCVLQDEILISTNNQGFFRLNKENFNLEIANSGLHSGIVNDIAGYGNDLWAACSNGLFTFNQIENQWTSTSLPLIPYGYNLLAVSEEGYLACQSYFGYTVYISKDKGLSWLEIDLRDYGELNNYLSWVDEKLYIETFNGTVVFEDNIFDYAQVPNRVVFCNGAYFGTLNWKLHTSVDNGVTWTELSPNIPDYAHLFSSGDRLFLYSWPDYFHYTSVDGVNWEYSGDGLPNGWTMQDYIYTYPKLRYWKLDDKYFTSIRGGGLFVSLDTCKSWLPVEKSWDIYDYLNGSFYRGAFGGGIRKTGIPDQYGSLVKGKVFNDINNNGIIDSGEAGVPDARISVLEPTAYYPFWFTSTDDEGKYTVSVSHGAEDTIRIDLTSNYASVTPEYHLVNDPDDPYDFAVYFEPDITDFALNGSYVQRPRPGFDLSINLTCKNVGTIPGDAKVSLKLDSDFEFIQANPAPSSVYPDSLVWNLPTIPMFSETRIHMEGKLSVDAILGDELVMEANLTTLLTDSDLSNNVLILADTIVGSFDPNEKRVFPQAGFTREEIAEGKELEYTIHFQNTGTYLAEKVVLTDQLDTTLNWSSFRYIDASHPVTKWELLPGGFLRVEFDQINLPDSISNEPESHGYYSFAISRNAHDGNYTNCLNSAAIFFDFNHPIITNTTVSRVIDPVVVSVNESTFYSQDKNILLFMPNPSGVSCMLSTNQLLKGSGIINIYYSNGGFVKQINSAALESDFQLDTSELPNGMYIITAQDKDRSISGKLIVLR
jgi:uncharacterized repeat protein (TIGR01451 family)